MSRKLNLSNYTIQLILIVRQSAMRTVSAITLLLALSSYIQQATSTISYPSEAHPDQAIYHFALESTPAQPLALDTLHSHPLYQHVQHDASQHHIMHEMDRAATHFRTLATNDTSLYGPIAMQGCPSRTYWSSVQIGSQSFNMVVDTGSSTSAVAGSKCRSTGSCPSDITPVYNESAAQSGTSSATYNGQSISSKYGDGSGWSGVTITDTAVFDGVSGRMTFAAIETQASFFPETYCTNSGAGEYQGILGLAFESLLLPGTTAFSSLITADHNISPVICMQLCSTSGNIWMGGCDTSTFSSALQYVPVDDRTYFATSMDYMSIGSTTLSHTSNDFGTVIVDSGSASFILPTNIYHSTVAAITSNTQFLQYFPSAFFASVENAALQACYTPTGAASLATMNAALPPLVLQLNGLTLTLTAINSYVLQYIDQGQTYYCPGIRPYDESNTARTVLGYTILNQFITIYDPENAVLGFAPSNSCGNTSTSTTSATTGSGVSSGPSGGPFAKVLASASSVSGSASTNGYQLVVGGWGDCSDSCFIGGGHQTRTVTCRAPNAMIVDNSYCAGQTAPDTSRTCPSCPLSPAVAITLISVASVVVAAILFLILFCIFRRRHTLKRKLSRAYSTPRFVGVATPTSKRDSTSYAVATPLASRDEPYYHQPINTRSAAGNTYNYVATPSMSSDGIDTRPMLANRSGDAASAYSPSSNNNTLDSSSNSNSLYHPPLPPQRPQRSLYTGSVLAPISSSRSDDHLAANKLSAFTVNQPRTPRSPMPSAPESGAGYPNLQSSAPRSPSARTPTRQRPILLHTPQGYSNQSRSQPSSPLPSPSAPAYNAYTPMQFHPSSHQLMSTQRASTPQPY